jgi:hypothetical protein
MTTELWGVFDLGRKSFMSRSISHSDEYIGVILHDPSRAVVEAWLDGPGSHHGRSCDVRIIHAEYAHLLSGCVCAVHAARLR